MSKITRHTGNLVPFAGEALANERTTFGTGNQDNDLNAQITEQFKRGWFVIGTNELPPKQWFNGIHYTMSQFLAYLFQTGVAEWNSEQEYYEGSVCTHAGEAWMATVDEPTDEPEADSQQWKKVLTTDDLSTNADGGTVAVRNQAGTFLISKATADGHPVRKKEFDELQESVNTKANTSTQVIAGTGLNGGGNLSANRTLSVKYGTTAGTATQGNDSRITGAAQKAANLSDLSSAAAARQNLGLGTAATRDVGEASGNVMEVGAFGIGRSNDLRGKVYTTGTPADLYGKGYVVGFSDGSMLTPPIGGANKYGALEVKTPYSDNSGLRSFSRAFTIWDRVYVQQAIDENTWGPWRELISTGNIRTTTGQSTQYPMTQKATTDAINNSAIGVGQTWQDVTGSRSIDTTYTNTTGRAIMVVQVSEYFYGSDPLEVFVDNVKIMSVDQGNGPDWTGPVSFVVPNGSSYRIEKKYNPNIASWVELR